MSGRSKSGTRVKVSQIKPTKKRVEDMPLVLVEWIDALQNVDDEEKLEDVEPQCVSNHTVGFLAKETETEIVLVSDATIFSNTVRGMYGIPKVNILRILTASADWSKSAKRPEREHV